MEKLEFRYPAAAPARSRAVVGVVGSGDLEVLVEPGAAGLTTVHVTTSVDGHAGVWRAQLDRMFLGDQVGEGAPAVRLQINDFGATPGVVGLRIAQAFEQLAQTAGDR